MISFFSITAKENTENGSVAAKKCDRIVVCDPNHNEEAIMDGKLVLGINPYKEICTLHLAGKMIIDKVIKTFSCKHLAGIMPLYFIILLFKC